MDAPRPIRRRTMIAAGTAWAAPTAVLATAAPALAVSASCATACPSLAWGGGVNTNGWVWEANGSFDTLPPMQPPRSYRPSTGNNACSGTSGGSGGGTLDDAIVVETNPVQATTPEYVTYTHPLCLTSGYRYTFAFTAVTYGTNVRAAYLDTRILRAGSAVATAPQVSAPAGSKNKQEPVSFSYAPVVSENLSFELRWTFGATPASYAGFCNQNANDIGLSAPTITCQRL